MNTSLERDSAMVDSQAIELSQSSAEEPPESSFTPSQMSQDVDEGETLTAYSSLWYAIEKAKYIRRKTRNEKIDPITSRLHCLLQNTTIKLSEHFATFALPADIIESAFDNFPVHARLRDVHRTLDETTLVAKHAASRYGKCLPLKELCATFKVVRRNLKRVIKCLEGKDKHGVALATLIEVVFERLEDLERRRDITCHGSPGTFVQLSPEDMRLRDLGPEIDSWIHPETRRAIISSLQHWALSSHEERRVCVLHGHAGIGKTTIADALWHQLPAHSAGAHLSFDTKEGTQGDPNDLMLIIADLLSESVAGFEHLIDETFNRPSNEGPTWSLETEAEELIMKPLARLQSITVQPIDPILIIVEDLDRCSRSHRDAIEKVTALLCRMGNTIPFLRILICTRPEAVVMNSIRGCLDTAIVYFEDLQDVPRKSAEDEIRLFIRSKLAHNSAQDRPLSLLYQHPEAVEVLTGLSDGFFMYASCVVRELTPKNPAAIELYNALVSSDIEIDKRLKIFHRIYELYSKAMDDALRSHRDDPMFMFCARRLLATIALADKCFSVDLFTFMGMPPDTTLCIIHALGSLLLVGPTFDKSTIVRPMHSIFSQFLIDLYARQDLTFLVDGHGAIAACLLNYLTRSDALQLLLVALKRQIEMNHARESHHGSSGSTTIEHLRSQMYAFSQWASHLCLAIRTDEIDAALGRFIETRLTQWRVVSEKLCLVMHIDDYTEIRQLGKVARWYEQQHNADKVILNVLHRTVSDLQSTQMHILSEQDVNTEPRPLRELLMVSHHHNGNLPLEACIEGFERVLDDAPSCKSLRQIKGDKAVNVVRILDKILCHGALPVDMRRRSIKTMRKICSLNAIYPPAFLIPPGSVKVCNATQAACGGFGKVYRGELHGRAVAIKVANSDVMHMKSSFNDITGLFSGEAVIWRYLEHPNILPFYGVDTELFPMSCVSKWMAGGTIDVYLCNNQAENRIRLAIGVARGLEYLHLHNIRHGDLKSRNIMVDETGEAYIGDFGAAQFAYPADTNSLSTASLSVGTAPWMPPEVFKAWLEEGQTYRQTTKVDIYSFAMVVWELFTGWIPFRHLVSSDMVSTLVMKGMRLKPRPPATIPLGLSDTIWELMQKCWSQDPEARPTAASIVVSLDGENWHARQLGTPSEWPLPLRYRRMESSSSGLIR